MPPADQTRRTQHRHLSLLGLASSLALSALGVSGQARAGALPAPPRVEASGGLVFQSQGGGTPNTVTGYLLAPLSQGAQGQVLFLDLAANMNLGGALYQGSNVSAGASTRLGYRWLSGDQQWMYGFNAGVDTRQAYNNYAFQAGVGAEALSRNVELRVNGYIPFANQSDLYQSGYTNAYLRNNQLILDGWNRYVVSLGGTNLEVGVPLSRWSNNSLWLYASYYYLDGDYVNGSSGIRGRGELRLGNQLAIGATVSYDSIFDTQATGYVRYGAKPLAGSAKDAVDAAERNFLALRGLPMQRDVDLRMVSAQQNLPGSVATNPGNGGANWVVRCTGTTTNTGTANVSCANPSLDALLAAAGPGDVLLVGGGASSNLGGGTLRLAVGTSLTGSGSAPTLATQFGAVNLNPVFGSSVGAQAAITNGIISIGSNTTIAGFNFTNTSITNYSTSNVLIANNTFTGSYTDNPTDLATAASFGSINVSEKALPAIQLSGVDNLTISNNTFIYPQVQTYVSQLGTVDPVGTQAQPPARVCNQNGANTSGLCLSGNAIRLNNSTNTVISGNSVVGALDEAFRINNPSGTLLIDSNSISNMRMGPDSNIGTAIIVGQNQGTSTVTISNNSFSNNSPGVYPIVTSANQSGVPVAATTALKLNNIDPIEIGLCRGSTNYPRQQDLYADQNFSGNCNAPTTMNITVSGNTINLPAIAGGITQDGDGIDFNIGSNSILNANVSGNTVLTLGGTGDNGITFDIRGNAQARISITNNSINNVNKEAIDLGFTNTTNANQPGYAEVTLSGNVFSGADGLLNIGLIKNPGVPVSTFYVTGLDNNASQVGTTVPTLEPFNSGSYPALYLNGSRYVP
jgi:hypothetical protein